MDFFTVPTLTFRVLYCFFVIEHGRRKILHFNVAEHHFLAGFRLGPDCIWKSSLFGISLPSWNARFGHVRN